MATQNTTIQIRLDSNTKKNAQKIFEHLGLDISSGVKVFINQVIKDQAIPFPIARDSKKIRAKWDKEIAYALKYSKRYSSTEEMFNDILK